MNEIKVYTTSQCPYCVMVKNFLSSKNISFQEINVATNPEIMKKLVQTTGQLGVPQTEVNGKWIIGYDPNQIMSAIQN